MTNNRFESQNEWDEPPSTLAQEGKREISKRREVKCTLLTRWNNCRWKGMQKIRWWMNTNNDVRDKPKVQTKWLQTRSVNDGECVQECLVKNMDEIFWQEAVFSFQGSLEGRLPSLINKSHMEGVHVLLVLCYDSSVPCSASFSLTLPLTFKSSELSRIFVWLSLILVTLPRG